ncbi:MAG: hypothetical protein EA398_17590 [Deltaproteobacteria bacterium]|nr:MAG: hypothetical protein EA398_17590 [Deltaproteobacteria bacterium]
MPSAPFLRRAGAWLRRLLHSLREVRRKCFLPPALLAIRGMAACRGALARRWSLPRAAGRRTRRGLVRGIRGAGPRLSTAIGPVRVLTLPGLREEGGTDLRGLFVLRMVDARVPLVRAPNRVLRVCR